MKSVTRLVAAGRADDTMPGGGHDDVPATGEMLHDGRAPARRRDRIDFAREHEHRHVRDDWMVIGGVDVSLGPHRAGIELTANQVRSKDGASTSPCASSSGETRDESSLHNTESCMPMLMFSPASSPARASAKRPWKSFFLGAVHQCGDDRCREWRVERAEEDAGDEPRVDVDVFGDARPRVHDAHTSRMLFEAGNQVRGSVTPSRGTRDHMPCSASQSTSALSSACWASRAVKSGSRMSVGATPSSTIDRTCSPC